MKAETVRNRPESPKYLPEPKFPTGIPARAVARPARPLAEAGQSLWDKVMDEYSIQDCGGQELLLEACQCLDLAERLQKRIEQDGLVITTSNGNLKEHPALKSVLSARITVGRLLSRLGLAFEGIKNVGRPVASDNRLGITLNGE